MSRPPRSDTEVAAIVTAVSARPGPVLGDRGRPGWLSLPRLALDLVTRRLDGRQERQAFLALPFVSGFHPSGLFAPDLAELGNFLGVNERRVRKLLASLHAQSALVWCSRRALVFVPDVAHWSISNPSLARNVQVRIADYADCEPVRSAKAYFDPTTLPAHRVATTLHLAPCSDPLAPPKAMPNGRSSELRQEGVRHFDIEGMSYSYPIPIPAHWGDAAIGAALEHGGETMVQLAIDALLCAQRTRQRDTDKPDTVREFVADRLQVVDGLHLLRCVAIRYHEAQGPRHRWRYLCAPSCFGDPEAGSKPACTTSVMVSKAFDDVYADHQALSEAER